MSTLPNEPEARLHQVPWRALEGLASELRPVLSSILEGTAAERALDAFLRAHRELSEKQRSAVAEAVFGVGLWRRRLGLRQAQAERQGSTLGLRQAQAERQGSTPGLRQAQAERGAAQAERGAAQRGAAQTERQGSTLEFGDPLVMLGLLMRDLGGVPGDEAARLSGAREVATMPPHPPPEDLATRYSLPDWLAGTLVRELGEEAVAFARAIDVPGPVTLRANTLKTTREALAESLAGERIATSPTVHARAGLRVLERANLYGSRAFREGLFEVQDEGSQLLGELVGARPGESVLDFCAGAGGKTLELAAAMGNRGTLYVHDVDLVKLKRLEVRTRRAGVTCCRAQRGVVPEDLVVDRVLVDAPCSELGALRRGPDLRWRMDPASFEALPEFQLDLLTRAAKHVRPGGTLVYATCTIRHEENEDVVREFDARGRGFVRVRPGEGWLSGEFVRDNLFRALPHVHGTDGFFAGTWRRG